jgi:curli production assembly/transport component CsgF
MLAVVAGLGLAGGWPAAAAAQQLVYRFTDPSFGGNPFNGSDLMNVANAQNGYKDPRAQNQQTVAQIFASQLQSRLLSALSDQIVTTIFGANPQQSGTIRFGGQTVTFSRGLTDVTLNITDDAGGQTTTIVVPTTLTTK